MFTGQIYNGESSERTLRSLGFSPRYDRRIARSENTRREKGGDRELLISKYRNFNIKPENVNWETITLLIMWPSVLGLALDNNRFDYYTGPDVSYGASVSFSPSRLVETSA